jgi:3-hydroxybutyryl-CoA dehydrogenase
MTETIRGPVLVVGGGTMGAGIAACLAANGIDVVLWVRRQSAISALREETAHRIGRLKTLLGNAVHKPAGTLTVLSGELPGPFALAVESVAEDLESKRSILCRLNACVGEEGIIATNTSSLSLAALSHNLSEPGRFAAWHWFNPAELVRLVEVVAGPHTLPATLECLEALSKQIGKQPIVLRREITGFVANRLQYALLREAYALVGADICSVADIDHAVEAGLGARWAAIGPFLSMDAAGLDVHEAVTAQIFPQLSGATTVPQLLKEIRHRGAVGIKGGEGLRGQYSADAGAQIVARRDAVLAMLTKALHGSEV